MEWQRKPPVLYGWVIVCAGLWVTLVLFGLTNAFSVFFKPLSVEFGWDRGVTSLAYSISWLSFGVLSIGAGRLVDRYGPRAVMLGGLGIFVVGTLLLSQIRSLWQLYVIFGVVLSIGRAANLIPLITTVLGWFNTRRGLALALAQSQGVGTVLMVPLAAWLIAQYGWRFSYTVLGVFILVTAAPLLLLIRQAPGGAPGAGARVPSRPSEPAQSLEPQDWTLRQALRSHTFWVANAIVFCCCTCHSVLLLHLINFFTDQGMPASHAATIFAVISGSAMVGKLCNGALADRIGGRLAITLFLGLQTAMVPWFYGTWPVWGYWLIGILFGLGMGGPMPTYALLFREFFGQRAIGAILGVFTAMYSTGMAVGGYMGGVLHDYSDNYLAAFGLSICAGLLATGLTFFLRPPRALPPTPRRDPHALPAPAFGGPSVVRPSLG